MKRIILIALAAVFIAGCGDKQVENKAEVAQVQPVIDHYYSLKDGFDYGYEKGISQADAEQGQAAATLLMFKYAGMKDGQYQLYSKEGSVSTVIECGNPCSYMKIMVFSSGLGHIKTERMRATEGTVGWSAMSDAINGKLERFVGERDGRKFNVWWDERQGARLSFVDTK